MDDLVDEERMHLILQMKHKSMDQIMFEDQANGEKMLKRNLFFYLGRYAIVTEFVNCACMSVIDNDKRRLADIKGINRYPDIILYTERSVKKKLLRAFMPRFKGEKIKQCGNPKCNRVNTDDMKICGGCQLIYFCSRRCQKICWNRCNHKYHCMKLRD